MTYIQWIQREEDINSDTMWNVTTTTESDVWTIVSINEDGTMNFSIKEKCKHEKGWYGYVHTFWSKWLGSSGIEIFCCSDCGKLFQDQELRDLKHKKYITNLKYKHLTK